jgi:D-3-phosphoglycerate dehydrogenase
MALLQPALANINMVSAPAVARERNIEVAETRRDRTADYNSLIRLTVTTEKGVHTVAGSLFGGNKPRLVAVEDIPLEAELTGNMLFVRNEDRPGLIGNLGRTLGDAGVNIASFHLGRKAIGFDAIALVAIDQPVTEQVFKAVTAIPNVVRVYALRF